MKFLILAILTNISFSLTISEELSECSNKAKTSLFNKFSNFNQYHTIDGSGYSHKFLKIIKINTMDMIESKVLKEAKIKDVNVTILKIRLRPLPNATDLSGELYPKFYLKCKSDPKNFTLTCNMMKNLPHFALDDFKLKVGITNASTVCKLSDSSTINISYFADINDQEYDLIEEESVREMRRNKIPVTNELIGLLFNAEDFFKSYWRNFFNKWQNS